MSRIDRCVFAASMLVLSAAASAAPAELRYGDTLLAAASRRAGAALHIDARGADGITVAIGTAVSGGSSVPLSDAMGNPIGTLIVAPRARQAPKTIASWLARHIYVAGNLVEPDPFVSGAVAAPRAQALVDATLQRFPELVTLSLHVAQTGGENTIVASSFGRIGKALDKDDLHVERDGAVLHEVTNNGHRLAVELPLNDRQGETIGALSASFSVPPGTDPQSLYPRAIALRDAMARRIASRAALFAPY